MRLYKFVIVLQNTNTLAYKENICCHLALALSMIIYRWVLKTDFGFAVETEIKFLPNFKKF